jgi:hypothetical protein
MGAFGELFPGAKIKDEAGEAGDGQKWRLGPIDLEKGLVQVHLPAPAPAPEPDDDRQRSAE